MAINLSTTCVHSSQSAANAGRDSNCCVKKLRSVLCRTLVVACCLAVSTATAGCSSIGLRSAVTMRMNRVKGAPRDASVYIDEEFIGPLYYVAAHGVRLPTGKHRITITRDGFFPWDRVVEADRQPINLNIELTPIPD